MPFDIVSVMVTCKSTKSFRLVSFHIHEHNFFVITQLVKYSQPDEIRQCLERRGINVTKKDSDLKMSNVTPFSL